MTGPLATIVGRHDSERIEVQSLSDLDAALLRIAEGCDPDVPALAIVTRRDGDDLGIGLGQPHSVLTYTAKDLDPPYFISLGDIPRLRTIAFFLQGHHTEFDRRNLIPLDDAMEAVRRFVQSEGLPLPDNVRWEEV